MKGLEDQVASLENSKELAELGVKSVGLFFWCEYPDGTASILLEEKYCIGNSPYAYTTAELGELLPISIRGMILQMLRASNGEWHCYYSKTVRGLVEDKELILCRCINKTLVGAMAAMVIWLINNESTVTVEELNR